MQRWSCLFCGHYGSRTIITHSRSGTGRVYGYVTCIGKLSRHRGPWRGLKDLEYATLEWVDWFNRRRLFEAHGQIPPAEYEAIHYRHQESSGQQANTQTKQPA